MIRKQQGHVLYEIIILILVVGLLFSILYPSKIWKTEEKLAGICQARMDAIRKMEYLHLSKTNTFTDSVSKLIEVVGGDETQWTVLDTVIQWDALVTSDELKTLIMSKDLPAALVQDVTNKLQTGKPLGNIGRLDSVNYKLVAILENKIQEESVSKIDSCVSWYDLLGSNTLYNLVQNSDLSRTLKTRFRKAVLDEKPLTTTRGYSRIQPVFMDTLKGMIPWAQRGDVWSVENKAKWDETALASWSGEMDALPDSVKDALWQENISKFWDKERVIVWRDSRTKLWKEESENWTYDNQETWKRILEQKWKNESKKEWMNNQMATLPDSMLATFRSQRDSLWRVELNEVEKQMAWEKEQMADLSDSTATIFETQKDSIWKEILAGLQEEKFDAWLADHPDETKEVVQNLWESDRILSWEDQAFEIWLEEKNADMEKTWESLIEELWKTKQLELWHIEEIKMSKKRKCLRQLDLSVNWTMLLDEEEVNAFVDQLDMPDNTTLWSMMNVPGIQGNAVVYYGLGGLVRDDLMKTLDTCPVSHQPHIIEPDLSTSLKKIKVSCPIVDTSKVAFALKFERTEVVNDSTNEVIGTKIDTVQVPLQTGFAEKIFGGREVKSHGFIDDEGKKSWEKRQ